MSQQIRETFSNDLRYRAETISIEDLGFDLSDEDVQKPYFDKEELDLIWDTLKLVYEPNDDHYIIMYLLYYLGFSYRKAGAVVGRVPSLVFLYEEQAVHAVRVLLGIELIQDKDPRDLQQAVMKLLNLPFIGFTTRDAHGKIISRPKENTPRKIQKLLAERYAEKCESK